MANRTPSEQREMFGRNLRILASEYASVSDLARKLSINRTQFNRYLSGDSFPRPDILARICTFFGKDARILLEPIETLTSDNQFFGTPFLKGYMDARMQQISEAALPSGFYRFARRSFVESSLYVVGIVHIHRQGANAVLRGFESRAAMRLQGLPTDAKAREFRGLVMQQEDGITILASRQNTMTCSFNYLSRVASFQNNFWVGYATRTVMETADGLRATRLTYEYIGPTAKDALATTQSLGFKGVDELPPFHSRLLRPDVPFS